MRPAGTAPAGQKTLSPCRAAPSSTFLLPLSRLALSVIAGTNQLPGTPPVIVMFPVGEHQTEGSGEQGCSRHLCVLDGVSAERWPASGPLVRGCVLQFNIVPSRPPKSSVVRTAQRCWRACFAALGVLAL